MKYEIRPLSPHEWPQEFTKGRPYARFRSSWNDTLALLDYELGRLDARNVVLEVNYRPGDIRKDGMPRADAKSPEFPGVILSFDTRRHGPLRYLTDAYQDWTDNVRAIALSLEALRAVDRYGVSKRGEQYRGWGALPPGTPMGPAAMTVVEAARVLGITLVEEDLADRTAWRAAVKVIFRDRAKTAHPDMGGDPDEYRRLVEARDLLLEAAAR